MSVHGSKTTLKYTCNRALYQNTQEVFLYEYLYIGPNIKRLRLKKQITQEQLSLAMGVSCAAVSKWERENTLPDISLLPLLANYFDISIDELMGYDAARIEEEIDKFFEERSKLFCAGKVAEYTQLSEKAYQEYPNDYRVMNRYMWDKAGDYADNDLSVILANKEELLSICQRILDGCNVVSLRLDAINMQGKILHVNKKCKELWFCNRYDSQTKMSRQRC